MLARAKAESDCLGITYIPSPVVPSQVRRCVRHHHVCARRVRFRSLLLRFGTVRKRTPNRVFRSGVRLHGWARNTPSAGCSCRCHSHRWDARCKRSSHPVDRYLCRCTAASHPGAGDPKAQKERTAGHRSWFLRVSGLDLLIGSVTS